MTFDEYYAELSPLLFPEGEAENLVNLHKTWVKDALIDLQTKVPCLRVNHAEYIGQTSTIFNCGASVFDDVDGNIERVYTLLLSGGCDRVDYRYVDDERMLEMMKEVRCCRASDAPGMNPYGIDQQPGPPEYMVADDTTDKGYRATAGYWTLNRGQVFMFPAIESTEQAVVEWTGIKRTFCSTTAIPKTLRERDVMAAVTLYVEAEVERRETRDASSYREAAALYQQAVGQLIWECRRKTKFVRPLRAQPDHPC
jgi:hypothetical protein